MQLKYKDSSIELWANEDVPGWNLIVRPAANVMPIMPSGKVLLMRETKPVQRQTLLGFPGGMIEDGESAKEAATREAAEELGIVVSNLEKVTTVRTAFPNTSVTYFIGWYVAEAERKQWEKSERASQVSVDQLFKLALEGKISDPRQVVGVLALKRRLDCGTISLTKKN